MLTRQLQQNIHNLYCVASHEEINTGIRLYREAGQNDCADYLLRFKIKQLFGYAGFAPDADFIV
jgi:hypothetical protein